MTSAQDVTVTNLSTAERLSEALAEVFRTAEVGDVLTDDVFLDGNPPLWRFQLQGIEAFANDLDSPPLSPPFDPLATVREQGAEIPL